MNQEKIGKFIAKCRKDKKMTQQDLANKLNVSDRAVSNWENGKNMPDLSLFKPLCEILEISVNDLLNGEFNNTTDVVENTIEYANKEINKVKKKSRKKTICIILIFIVSLSIIFGISDYNNIKYGENPNFMIRITDGGKTIHHYIGLGYTMERKVGVSFKEPLISDIYVRFGILFFNWDVDILKTTPDNLFLFSNNNHIMANMGSYCWTSSDKKVSKCNDTIDPIDMNYHEVLNVTEKEQIYFDLKDSSITKITLYKDKNIVDHEVEYNNENNTITIPNMIGEYLIVIDTKSEQGNVLYSFKVNIEKGE